MFLYSPKMYPELKTQYTFEGVILYRWPLLQKKANNTPLSTPFQPMEVALHSCQLRTCEGVGR